MNIASVTTQAYAKIASGSSINRAADNPAGLAITEGMDSQIKGMEQNVTNMGTMSDLADTAEGALASVNDSLGRMRDLAVQASNGILSDDDRSLIQNEISQLKEGINEVSKNTEFNSTKLLDGSFADKHTAMNPDGSGMDINIASSSLEALGIADFDVTGDFSISAIDDAIDMVSESRSNLGSISNAFDYASKNASNNMTNLASAKSQISDTDMAAQISLIKKQEILDQYSMFAQKAKMESERTELGVMQGFDATL